MAETTHLSQYPVPVHKTVLDNGLTVITAETGSAFCRTEIIIRTGGVDDDPETWGLAHLSEHLHYQADDNREPHPSLKSMFEKGVHGNAQTDNVSTGYHVTGLVEHVPEIACVLTSIVFHRTFTEDRVAMERPIVTAEYDERRDSALMTAFRGNAQYAGSPWLHADAIGNPETIALIDAAGVNARHARDYVTGNAAIILCGGITHAHALELVRYVTFPAGPRRPIPPPPPLRLEVVKAPHPVAGKAPSVRAYWRLPDKDRFIHPVGLLLNAFLTGSRNGLLAQRLRQKLGIVYSIGADLNRNTAVCNVSATTKAEHHDRVISELKEAIESIASDGIPDRIWEAVASSYRIELIEQGERMRGPLAWKSLSKTLSASWIQGAYETFPDKLPFGKDEVRRYARMLADSPMGIIQAT